MAAAAEAAATVAVMAATPAVAAAVAEVTAEAMAATREVAAIKRCCKNLSNTQFTMLTLPTGSVWLSSLNLFFTSLFYIQTLVSHPRILPFHV